MTHHGHFMIHYSNYIIDFSVKRNEIMWGMKKKRKGELYHVRYVRGVIKMTSDGESTNVVSSCRWTHNEESFQGLWRRTKSGEAKDEVQQENQFSPPSSPLPLRERFTGRVMTAYNNNSHILLLQSDNSIRSQSNLPQNKVVITAMRAYLCVRVRVFGCWKLLVIAKCDCATLTWSAQFIAVRDKGFWG